MKPAGQSKRFTGLLGERPRTALPEADPDRFKATLTLRLPAKAAVPSDASSMAAPLGERELDLVGEFLVEDCARFAGTMTVAMALGVSLKEASEYMTTRARTPEQDRLLYDMANQYAAATGDRVLCDRLEKILELDRGAPLLPRAPQGSEAVTQPRALPDLQQVAGKLHQVMNDVARSPRVRRAAVAALATGAILAGPALATPHTPVASTTSTVAPAQTPAKPSPSLHPLFEGLTPGQWDGLRRCFNLPKVPNAQSAAPLGTACSVIDR